MIRVIRRFRASSTAGEERVQTLKAMLSLLNERHPRGYEVHISRLGELGVIMWTGDFDNLAAFEAWQASVTEDEEFMKRYQELGDKMIDLGLIIPGTAEDLVFAKVE